ncbi:MAG: hypothetical protein AAGA64_18210 [Bacteroidota bacterium]
MSPLKINTNGGYALISIALLATITIGSCKSGKNIQRSETKSNSFIEIAFLSFDIYEKADEELTVDLTNLNWVEGKIKEHHNQITGLSKDTDLDLEFLDGKKNKVKTVFVQNPLNPTLEYFSENGKISKKSVRLEKASFSMRTMLPRNVKYIRINYIDGNEISLIKLE